MKFSRTALGLPTLLLLSLLLSQGTTPSPVQAQSASELAELERLVQELEQMERDLEPLLQDLESLEALGQQLDGHRRSHPFDDADAFTNNELIQRNIERAGDYHADLAACSPATYEDYPFPGVTDSIRGWVGDTCQVDQRINVGEVQSISQCFYTLQDIELITGPELYFSEDLERQCHRLK